MASSSNINRRALVAGAAAALPAIAAMPANAADAADAELLALGDQLEPLIEQWMAQTAADREECEADPDPELTRWHRLNSRIYPLVDAILSQRAQTLAGLAVQARAFTLSSSEWWDSDLTCEDDQLAFANAVCAFLGVTPVPLMVRPAPRSAA
jgi:hypothetical protein